MTLADDLERIARRLTPEAIRSLAEHLEACEGPGRSDVAFFHRPDGIVKGLKGHKQQKTVDLHPTDSVGSPPS